MPQAPAKVCAHPGCGAHTHESYCPDHKRERSRAVEFGRKTAAQRGYGHRWRKYTKSYLGREENALCRICLADGRTTAAECVDHIVDHKGDHKLFWDPKNHQAACLSCNSRKAATEGGRWG